MDDLSVSSYHYDGFPVVEVSGELDFETREQLGKRLHKAISTHNPAHVTVHLNGLEFCDAPGRPVGTRTGQK
ncbi:STAS domain-containing protein [Streptomyces vietnamensis]|uniref:STAS domain-containing protein n=1 Tax=Streptomyces vietnamensis TaxID=362257 RepID=UPI00342E3FAB